MGPIMVHGCGVRNFRLKKVIAAIIGDVPVVWPIYRPLKNLTQLMFTTRREPLLNLASKASRAGTALNLAIAKNQQASGTPWTYTRMVIPVYTLLMVR